LKKHLPHLEVKRILPGAALRKIEKEIADCITEYFDEQISVDEGQHPGLPDHLGSPLFEARRGGPRQGNITFRRKVPQAQVDSLRRGLAQLKEEVGVDTRVHQAAMSDAQAILTTRICWLVANKKDFIISGTDNKLLIQLLGDTCGIFKKNKVQGTSIVLKTI
jgi:hypothetical protein